MTDDPTLFPLPKSRGSARPKTPSAKLRAIRDAFERYGCLVPRSLVAEVLGVSRQWVHTLLKRRKVSGVKVLGTEFVRLDDVEQLIEDRAKRGP